MIQFVLCESNTAIPPGSALEHSKFKIQNSKFLAWEFVQ
jgi:hypothetical protein